MMKKKQIIFTIVIFVFIISFPVCAFADLSPLSNPNITTKTGYIVRADKGNISIYFNVTANSTMNILGASSITLYTSDGTYVTTLSSADYSNMLASDTNTYGSHVSYKGISGQTYYAIITFYAESASGSSTSTYTTASVTA